MMECDTIIVSDVHLGSSVSLAAQLHRLLHVAKFKRLILLGDIFSDLNFSRLTKQHWALVGHIRKLSNPKRGVEVVWVEGNHDDGVSDVMEHLLGIKVHMEYTWDWNGAKCLALHGHQFDSVWGRGSPVVRRYRNQALSLAPEAPQPAALAAPPDRQAAHPLGASARQGGGRGIVHGRPRGCPIRFLRAHPPCGPCRPGRSRVLQLG